MSAAEGANLIPSSRRPRGDGDPVLNRTDEIIPTLVDAGLDRH